ncbi:hypothetical protein HAALTHF_25360n [Vreelandella aquamarina]|nr:hypothetical protein HAALTHF_25360n [Halomonas axialensis]
MFPLAIATGNTFVLKPSEQDPSSTMRLVELAHEAGIPAGVLNVVHGGPDVANQIADHQDIKALSFIGSTHVGSLLYNRAAAAGKRMQAMMGAKNHCVVMPDANRSQAIDSLLGSAFGAAGQRCMANSVVVLVGGSARVDQRHRSRRARYDRRTRHPARGRSGATGLSASQGAGRAFDYGR